MLLIAKKTPEEINNAEMANMCGCALRRFGVPIRFSFDGFPSVLMVLLLLQIGIKVGEIVFGWLSAHWPRAQRAM